MLLHNLDNSYLARLCPPAHRFTSAGDLPESIRPVWLNLKVGKFRPALKRGYAVLRSSELADEARAALLGALATAEWSGGVPDSAEKLARESLALFADQWLSNRVLLNALLTAHRFEEALDHLAEISASTKASSWDEPLSEIDLHLLRAACAWKTQDWNATMQHLTMAYPGGVATMPDFLQEDWLRLSFYREDAGAAADAVGSLIDGKAPERADVLIQTLVQQGWHKEALDLYRSIYEREPANELLRRRIVGLCIREGEVMEARRLMERGALRLAG